MLQKEVRGREKERQEGRKKGGKGVRESRKERGPSLLLQAALNLDFLLRMIGSIAGFSQDLPRFAVGRWLGGTVYREAIKVRLPGRKMVWNPHHKDDLLTSSSSLALGSFTYYSCSCSNLT